MNEFGIASDSFLLALRKFFRGYGSGYIFYSSYVAQKNMHLQGWLTFGVHSISSLPSFFQFLKFSMAQVSSAQLYWLIYSP